MSAFDIEECTGEELFLIRGGDIGIMLSLVTAMAEQSSQIVNHLNQLTTLIATIDQAPDHS